MLTSLQRAINLSSEAIVVYESVRDTSGTLTDMRIWMVNDAAVRIFGIARAAAEGQLLSAIWPVEYDSPSWVLRNEVLDTGEPRSFEWFTEAMGEPRWFVVDYQLFEDKIAASYQDVTAFKKATAEAEQQKAFYEQLLKHSTTRKAILSAVFDDDGAITDFRYEWANYGKGIDDSHRKLPHFDVAITGILATELLPSIKRTPIFDFYKEVFTAGKPMRTELWYRADRINVAVALTGQKLDDGRILVTYADVSDVHHLALDLEKERARLDAVFENVPLGMTVFESIRNASGELTDLRLVRRNEQALRLSRIPAEKYQAGKLLSELMPDELRDSIDLMLNVVRTSIPVVHELYQPHLNIWIQSRIMKHGDGVLSTLQDVTHLKQQSEESRRQTELLEGVLEASPNGITVFDALRDADGAITDFRVLLANEKIVAASGASREAYFGKTFFERRPEFRSEVMAEMVRVVETRRPEQTETYIPDIARWMRSSFTPLGDGLVATIEDVTEQKGIMARIERSAGLLNAVLDASPIAIVVYEAMRDGHNAITDFMPVIANKQAIALSGMTAVDFMKMSLYQRDPRQRESTLPQLSAVTELREIKVYEQQPVGTQTWVRSVTTPFGDGFIATAQDITEQRIQAEELALQAHTLEGVMQASPHAILVFETMRDKEGTAIDFRFIRFNEKATMATNLSAEQLSHATLFTCMPVLRERLPLYLKVVEEGAPETYEFFNEHLKRWRRITNTPLNDGFVMTMEDITEQKAQTAQLAEQAELFNGILASLQNGLSIFRVIRDSEGRLQNLEYLEVADSVLRDTRKRRDEMVGQSIRTLYPGIEDTDYWKAYTEVAETGQPASFETHFTLSGYDNYLLNWVTPISHDRMVSVYYLVNDLKRAQRELEHTVHELKRSNEDLEQFASIASHDLQEPLRKVQSFGAMLESRYAEALGESGKDLVGRMQSAANRMRNLVTGLLTFSRLSGDGAEPLRPVDLNALIADIATDLEQSLQTSGGCISVKNRLPFVMGIEGQLRHLFQNVLSNALKFRKQGVAPEVQISAEPLAAGDADRLSPLVSAADYIRIEIADNGIGFEPEFAEKIFGLFERLHGMSEYQGTGIGLSISRRVAERHLGAIWATGQKGVGATFVLLLQRAV